jgi:hypothetical protein
MLLGIFLGISGVSCTNTPPMLEPCVIITEKKAHCIPQDPAKKEYERFISDMIGDITLTAKEVADLKKWIKSILEDVRFNQLQEISEFQRDIHTRSVPGEGQGRD